MSPAAGMKQALVSTQKGPSGKRRASRDGLLFAEERKGITADRRSVLRVMTSLTRSGGTPAKNGGAKSLRTKPTPVPEEGCMMLSLNRQRTPQSAPYLHRRGQSGGRSRAPGRA